MQMCRDRPLEALKARKPTTMKNHAAKKRWLPDSAAQQRIQPVIIHTLSPRVVFAEPGSFMWIVQSLTGSSDTRLRCEESRPCSSFSTDRVQYTQKMLDSSSNISSCSFRSAINNNSQGFLQSENFDSTLLNSPSCLLDEIHFSRRNANGDEGLLKPASTMELNSSSPVSAPLSYLHHGFHHQQRFISGHEELLEPSSSDLGSSIIDEQLISSDCEVLGDHLSPCSTLTAGSSDQDGDLLFSKPFDYSFIEMFSTNHMDKSQLFPVSTRDSYLEHFLM